MAKIFISYSRRDTDEIDHLIGMLESAKHDVWVDTQDIRAGSQWQTSIVQAIVESDFFIIALSKNSAKSDNVRRELVIAVNQKKGIIPVCIQDVELPPEMQYQLAGIQRINFHKDSQKEIGALLSVLDTEESAVHRTLTRPQAQSIIKKNLWIVLSLSVLVSLIIVITLIVRGFAEKSPETPVGISVKENDSSPVVELDIKVMNRGDEGTFLTIARIYIQDFKSFPFAGCYRYPSGGYPVSSEETYDLYIRGLEKGETKDFSISQFIPTNEPDHFIIILRPTTYFDHWGIYKLNLEFIDIDGYQTMLPYPIIFISKEEEQSATSAKFLYGDHLSDDDILERYKFMLGELKDLYGNPSKEEVISMVRECYEENLKQITDMFSDEGKMLNEENMILSDQARTIFNEWKNVTNDTP